MRVPAVAALVVALLAGAATTPTPAAPPKAPAEPACASLGGAARERFDTERYAFAFRTVPATIAVGQPFAIEFVVCPHGAGPMPTALRVDAQMPEHRHGMNYRPTVAAHGRGRFLAQGLVFHMPGRWQLIVDVQADSRTERIRRDVVVD